MDRRHVVGLVALLGVLVLGAGLLGSGLWVDLVGVGDYDRGTVTVYDGNGTTPTTTDRGTTVSVRDDGRVLGTVRVRIADTPQQRYVGLSETASLGPDEGMLFVHDEAATHAYVMRNMSFPLDILFVAPNGTITTIHHAPVPPEGQSDLRRYEGDGQYVLEVNRGWTNRTGVSVGDRVALPDTVP